MPPPPHPPCRRVVRRHGRGQPGELPGWRPLRLALLLALALGLLTQAAAAAPRATGPGEQHEPLANVRGLVWYDEQGAGLRTGGEPPAAGARIAIYPDPDLPAVYANADGAFAFSLPEGTYTLEVWWDSPVVAPAAPGQPSGAYYAVTRELKAGAPAELELGVRPTGRFPARIDARIQAVWPHDVFGLGRSVEDGPLANVVAYLYHAGTSYPVPCSYSPVVALVAALDDQPGVVVALGVQRRLTVQGHTLPVWEFNDVPVNTAQDPERRLYFWLQVTDDLTAPSASFAPPRVRSGVWAHGADGRTYSPLPSRPKRTGAAARVAGRVDVVWPHDGSGQARPVEAARFANVDVLLTDADDWQSALPAAYSREVWLLRSLNGGPAEIVRGRRLLSSQGDLTYPRWVFEDVDVAAATHPGNRYYFRVAVPGLPALSNVWAHGADGRTYFPERDVPAASGLDCEPPPGP